MTPPAEAALPTVEASRATGGVSLAPGRERTALLGVGLCGLAGVATLDPGAGADRPAARALPLALAVLLPLAVLLYALSRRGTARRAPLLLFGVPTALALGALARPGVPLEPIVFFALVLTLVAYVASAARLVGEPVAGHATARGSEHTPPRLLRRLRVYRVLVACAGLAFVVPIGVAVLDSAGGATQPLLTLSVGGLLGAVACRAFLVDALERHLQRDPALVGALARLRRHARRGRPARLFYAAAAIALVGMALFAARHALGLDAGAGG
jgi:hypothetical protein